MNDNNSTSLKVAAFLTFIGGFLEIYSFLLKGKVFATTITGNIILMIYNIYNLDFQSVFKYLVPIISFCVGIIVVESVKKREFKINLRWQERVLIFEMFLVLLIYIFKSNYFDIFTTSIISFMSATQIQAFKKARNSVYMSTMCTGNTRKLIESVALKDYENTKIFASLITAFSFGVIFGSVFVEYFLEAAILFLLVPLIIIFYLIKKENKE